MKYRVDAALCVVTGGIETDAEELGKLVLLGLGDKFSPNQAALKPHLNEMVGRSQKTDSIISGPRWVFFLSKKAGQ